MTTVSRTEASMRYRHFGLYALMCAALVIATPARADAIDGDWCLGADHMNINGSTILTPGRNTISGDYFRYRFNYVAPAGEKGAGGEVKMVMIRGTETVHVDRPGGVAGSPEVWRRCRPISCCLADHRRWRLNCHV
jgi:hypothetical protein